VITEFGGQQKQLPINSSNNVYKSAIYGDRVFVYWGKTIAQRKVF
jgi:hypothetical protein